MYIVRKVVNSLREDEKMCKALAEIMKPEIDEAFDNGFKKNLKRNMQSTKASQND